MGLAEVNLAQTISASVGDQNHVSGLQNCRFTGKDIRRL
jgi:hypothetical protein